jgi:hypothetical protein
MRELPSLGLDVRTELKVSFKIKKRLVSTVRLILTFSGEVWYAGVAVPGAGCAALVVRGLPVGAQALLLLPHAAQQHLPEIGSKIFRNSSKKMDKTAERVRKKAWSRIQFTIRNQLPKLDHKHGISELKASLELLGFNKRQKNAFNT